MNHSYLYFVFSRIVGLALKPLIILYLYNQGYDSEALLLSYVYLIFATVFVVLSVPYHYNFYKQYFDFEEGFELNVLWKSFVDYLNNLINHVVVFIPILLSVFVFLDLETTLIFLFLIYMLAEKVFDEVQRFLLFKKEFTVWSNIFMLKMILPIFIGLAAFHVFDLSFVYIYILSSILLIGVGVGYYLDFRLLRLVAKQIAYQGLQMQKTVKIFFKKYIPKFLFGLTNSNVMNADKWVVKNLSESSNFFTEYFLIGQISNMVVVGNNFAFISNRRADIIQKNNTIKSLWLNNKVVIYTALGGTLLGFGVITAIALGVLNLTVLTTLVIIQVMINYILFAVNAVIIEYLFWNYNPIKLVALDAFSVLVMLLLTFIFFTGYGFYSIVLSFSVALMMRLAISLWMMHKVKLTC